MSAASLLPWLAAPLRAALGHARGHAVLLHGPPGVGQFELAQALASAWLCEAAGADTRPCGACAACRLVQARTHPDLLVLLPEALRVGLGWDDGTDERADDGAEKGSKKKPSKEIRVEEVRELVAFAQTTAARGGVKVALIHPAERMNAIAANTLLKTLEEPPGALRIVLASAAPDRLLPTVRSRCQAIALALPEPDVAQAWLAEQGVQEPAVVLAAAGGQPLDAAAAAADGVDAALLRRLPALVRRGDAAPLAKLPLPRLVGLLHKLCHDVERVAAGAAPRYYPADALGGAPADPGALADWAATLAAAARHAEHPWNAALALEALIFRGQRALAPPRGTAREWRSLNFRA